MEIAVGQVWRSDLGGPPVMVVGFDENLIIVKRADYPKKMLAHTRGGGLVSRGEMQNWTLVKNAPQLREP